MSAPIWKNERKMRPGSPEVPLTASTATAKILFRVSRMGPALFPEDKILKPLPKWNSNYFGWLDPETNLCFAIFPARECDDGFDGMKLQIYVEDVDGRRSIAFIRLAKIESTYDPRPFVRYAVSYSDFFHQTNYKGVKEILYKAREIYPRDRDFFEYCLSMAKACHTHVLSIEQTDQGLFFYVINERDIVEFVDADSMPPA